MCPLDRRSVLQLSGIALGVGLSGCFGDGDSDTAGSPTDTPASETPGAECPGTSADYSWETTGSWHIGFAVSNDDEESYTATVEVIHHGSEPCHHAESTPCESPEKYVTAFERTFDLGPDESRTFTDIPLELWDSWIDDSTLQVRVENEDTNSRDRVFAYEKGAKEPVGPDEYERADFYVCDGTERRLDVILSNGTPHATPASTRLSGALPHGKAFDHT
ncbi:MAG: hypothetical protein ACI8U4_000853 [Natronomonas sp.]|jgi:hypothetical protein